MDDLERLKDGIGAFAEITLMFWEAIMDAGADEETAFAVTSIFMNMIMGYGEGGSG